MKLRRLAQHVGQFLLGLGILFAIIIHFTALSGYQKDLIPFVTSWGLGFIYMNGLWQGLIVGGIVLIIAGFAKKKPTIEIEKALYAQLKKTANEMGVPISDLVSDMISKGLEERSET